MSPRGYLADPQIQAAVDGLKSLITEHYPGTTFSTFEGDDPLGVHLRATVDLDDPDEVIDLIIDRLFAIQVEQELPVYVVSVRTPERRQAMARAKGDPWKPLTIPVTALG